MAQDILYNDLYVSGNVACKTFSPPAACIGNAAVQTPSPASGGIGTQKLIHRWQDIYAQGSSSTTAAADQKVVRAIRGGTGTILDFKAGCVVPCTGNATITVDLWKNGVSILSATITLNNSQSARQLVQAAGFTSTSLVATDVLEVKVTVNAGTGTLGQGLFAVVALDEDPA